MRACIGMRSQRCPGCVRPLAFFADRLKVHLRDKGARHDLIDAVFALGGQDDLALIVKRVEALGAFLKTDDGATLLAGVKRASNILRDEEKKDKTSYAGAADAALLREPQEIALYEAIQKVKADTVAAINVENFAGAMRALAELRAPVDAFFDKVTVNVTGVTEAARCAPTGSRCCPRSAPPPSTSPTSPRSPADVIPAQAGTHATLRTNSAKCRRFQPARERRCCWSTDLSLLRKPQQRSLCGVR